MSANRGPAPSSSSSSSSATPPAKPVTIQRSSYAAILDWSRQDAARLAGGKGKTFDLQAELQNSLQAEQERVQREKNLEQEKLKAAREAKRTLDEQQLKEETKREVEAEVRKAKCFNAYVTWQKLKTQYNKLFPDNLPSTTIEKFNALHQAADITGMETAIATLRKTVDQAQLSAELKAQAEALKLAEVKELKQKCQSLFEMAIGLMGDYAALFLNPTQAADKFQILQSYLDENNDKALASAIEEFTKRIAKGAEAEKLNKQSQRLFETATGLMGEYAAFTFTPDEAAEEYKKLETCRQKNDIATLTAVIQKCQQRIADHKAKQQAAEEKAVQAAIKEAGEKARLLQQNKRRLRQIRETQDQNLIPQDTADLSIGNLNLFNVIGGDLSFPGDESPKGNKPGAETGTGLTPTVSRTTYQ